MVDPPVVDTQLPLSRLDPFFRYIPELSQQADAATILMTRTRGFSLDLTHNPGYPGEASNEDGLHQPRAVYRLPAM